MQNKKSQIIRLFFAKDIILHELYIITILNSKQIFNV